MYYSDLWQNHRDHGENIYRLLYTPEFMHTTTAENNIQARSMNQTETNS